MRDSLVASLQRLGRDSVDLLQLHNTLSSTVDASGRSVGTSELDEIAAGMRALVAEGLVRHIGFTGVGETEALHENARSGRFETMQSYFNAINPSAGHAGKHGPGQDMAGVIDVAEQAGLGVIAIRVMAGGAMTGQEQRATLASPGLGPALVPGDTYEVDISRAVWLSRPCKRAWARVCAGAELPAGDRASRRLDGAGRLLRHGAARERNSLGRARAAERGSGVAGIRGGVNRSSPSPSEGEGRGEGEPALEAVRRARQLRRRATPAERDLWLHLRDRRLDGWKFRRQEPAGPYFIDFACREARLGIEVDGAYHAMPHAMIEDAERTANLEEMGWRLIRFSNDQVIQAVDEVLAAILVALRPSP